MKNLKQCLSMLLVVVMILSSFSGYGGWSIPVFADADPNLQLNIEHTTNKLEPKTGERFIYTIKYGVSGSYNGSTQITGLKIIEEVDPKLDFAIPDRNGDIKSITRSGNQIIIEFNDNLESGKTGVIPFSVWFKEGVTPHNAVANSTATFSVGENSKQASPPTVTAKADNITDIGVTKTANPDQPALDNFVYYTIEVEREPSEGGRNLENVVVTDTLPSGVTDVTAISPAGGVWDSSDNTITWSNQTVEVGSSPKIYQLRCKYGSADFNKNQDVTNNVEVRGQHIGDNTQITGTDSVTHHFHNPSIGNLSIQKHNRSGSAVVDRYATDQMAKFTISGVKNNGNVAINSIRVIDIIPTGAMTISSVNVGRYNSDVDMKLYYTMDGNLDYDNADAANYTLYRNNIAQGEEVSITTTGGATNITAVKLLIEGENGGKLPVGFGATSRIGIKGEIIAGSSDTIYENKVKAFINADAGNRESESSARFKVKDVIPWYDLNLSTKNSGYIDLDDIEYTLTLKNNDLSRGDIRNTIVGVEFIDENFDVNGYIAPQSLPNGVTELPDITGVRNGKACTYKRWKVGNTLHPGETVQIEFKNSFRDKNPKLKAGSYDNLAFIVEEDGQNIDWETENNVEAEHIDLDDDGDSNGKLITSTCSIFNKFQGSISGKKFIKGENDSDYLDPTTSTVTAHTLSGGYVNYKLEISNSDGNGPISDIVVIDKLPGVGDTSILSTQARDSEWNPYLIGEASVDDSEINSPQAGDSELKVYYSTKDSPDVSILSDTTKAINASDWSETPPDEIIDVTHILLKLEKYKLRAGDKAKIEFKMIAPFGVPLNQKVYNSFAFGGTYPDSTDSGKSSFIANEPPAVSHTIEAEGTDFGIGNRAFYDFNNNGLDDDIGSDGNKRGLNGLRFVIYKENAGNYDRVRHTYSNKDVDGKDGYYLFPKTLEAGNYKILCLVPKSKDLIISKLNIGDNGTEPATDNDFEALDASSIDDYDYEAGLDKTKYDFYIYKNDLGNNVIGLTGNDKNKFAENISVGLYRYARVSGKIFNDKNHNGKKESSEPFLAGAKVSLVCDANHAYDKAIITTTANGEYEFTDVHPAQYKLKVEAPSDEYAVSKTGSGTGIKNDFLKGVAPSANTSEMTLTVLSEDDKVKNAGMHKGIINGVLWFDKNHNGVKDNGETGLGGFTVKLYQNDANVTTQPLKTYTTANNGFYEFNDLDHGTYKLKIVPKVHVGSKDFKATVETTKIVGDDYSNQKSYVIEDDPNKNIIKDIELEKAAIVGNVGGGFYKEITLEGYIFNDTNLDAQFTDADDKSKFTDQTQNNVDSIGITITGGDLTAPISLNAAFNAGNGRYEWSKDLDPSTNAYVISYTNPDTTNLIATNQVANAQNVVKTPNNKNVFSANGNNIEFTLNEPLSSDSDNDVENTYYINSGLHKGLLKVHLYEDDNYDGNKALTETYLKTASTNAADKDVIVELLKSNGGTYSIVETIYPTSMESAFSKLDNGDYKIDVKIKESLNYKPTLNHGATETNETIGGVAYKVCTYPEFTITAGSKEPTFDIGFYRPAKIKTIVFYDKNYNGIREDGESKNGLITFIKPRDDSTATLGEAFTSGTGAESSTYTSGDLTPGTYSINYDFNQPAGIGVTDGDKYYITKTDQGSNDTKDSDISTAGLTQPLMFVQSANFTLVSGQVYEHTDLGLYKKVKITGNVFKEQDGTPNGAKDGSDVNFADQAFTATVKKDDTQIEQQTFTTLGNGNYTLYLDPYKEFVQLYYNKPNGYLISPENHSGGNDVKEEGLVIELSGSQGISLNSDSNKAFDYGLYKSNSISGKVYLDKNGNGTQQSADGENAISANDIIVHLLDGGGNPVNDDSGNPITTTVNAAGEYSFPNLKFGTYKVKVTRPSYEDSVTADISLNINDNVNDKNLGIFQKIEIKGIVFEEIGTSLDGIKNGSDEFYNGVTNGVISVTLNYSGGSTVTENLNIDSTTGAYSFKINPSSESVSLTYSKPNGFSVSEIAAGGNDVALNGTVASFTPTTGDVKTFNYGLYQVSSISGTVYHDKNADGNKEAGEGGIQATVTIYESDGTTVAKDSSGNPITVTVAADGSYTIPNLPAGDYKIKVEQAGYETLTEDVTVSTDEDKSLDLGIYKKVEISGFVFIETGVPDGIRVVGVDAGYNGTITATFTDATNTPVNTFNIPVTNGTYSFEIEPSNENLTLKYSIPSGHSVSPKKANEANGSDIDTSGVTFKPTSDDNKVIDYGLYESNTVNGLIYHDLNANDTQDTGESTISATVTLYESDGTTVATDSLGNNITTTVGADGVYTFNDVREGDYIVKVEKAGFETVTHDLTVNSNQTSTENLGIYQKVEISGIVFVEKDTPNGEKDGNDVFYDDDGVNEKIKVTLTYSDGNTIDETLDIGADGTYSFKIVPSAKDLTLKYSTPNGYCITQNSSSVNGNDVSTNGTVTTFKPTSGEDKAIDYGIYKKSKISGTIYHDKDADNTQEAGENGITAEVHLLDGNGNPVLDGSNNPIVVTANADGTYSFDGLDVGNYKVKVVKSGYENISSGLISVNADENVTQDVGIYKKVKITGKVFDEKYNQPNGQKDGADIDFTGTFAATLKKSDGTLVETVNNVNVNADGTYEFYVNPNSETLTMTYSVPSGYSVSPVSNVAGGNEFNSNNSGVSVTPTSGTDESFDYGIYKSSKITGSIFHDKNADGTQEAGEQLITANTKIHLLNVDGTPVIGADNNPIIVDVKADGTYDIVGVDAGNYKIKVVNTTDGYEQVKSGVVTVTDGQTSTQNVGLYKKVKITGKVFDEKYNQPNGQKDGADIDFTGTFTATLKKSDGTLVETVNNVNVNADGTYEFYVKPNSETLTMTYSVPSGYSVSPVSNVAGGNEFNSNNSGVSVTPTSGTDESFDYGIYKSSKITGSIFHDKNADGTQEAGEQLITANTKIHLLNADGTPVIGADNNPIIVDVKADGTYDIVGVDAGNYKIKVVNTTDGYEQITSGVVAVTDGQTSTQNVGLYKKAKITGKVFEDRDRNGVNNSENGFSDIKIQVKLGANNIGNPITPAADGSFTTIALKPDNYHLQVILPSGKDYYKLSAKDVGNDDSIDSDIAISTLKSDSISLTSGNPITNIGIGVYKLVTIKGKVEDFDKNSSSKNPIQGAIVHLLDANGNPILDDNSNPIIVTTDANGNYSIPNMYPYTVYNLRVESSYKENGVTIDYPVINKVVPSSNGGDTFVNFVSLKYKISLLAEPRIIVGDGNSKSKLTFKIINEDGIPVQNANVRFDANLDEHGNNIPTSKKGTFDNALAVTPNEITVITDNEGKAVVNFQSANLRGFLEKQTVLVKAIANLDNGQRLEDSIIMVLEPLSIKGTVKGSGTNGKIYSNTDIRISQVIDKTLADNDPRLMSGFKDGYRLSKITSGVNAGKLLFEYRGKTDENGNYKIFVPYDGVDENNAETYDVKVIVPAEQSPTNKKLEFIQQCAVNKKSQTLNSSADDNVVDSDKTIVGTLVMRQENDAEGEGSLIANSNSKISVEYTQAGNVLKYSVNGDGILVPNPNNAKLTNGGYTRNVYYTFANGQKIIISSETFAPVTNGKLIVEDILIDPRGVVTDINTGNKIVGATVTLYDNVTGLKVPLPANPLGFSNNANPQNTTVKGEYAWMVFPNKTYYIKAQAAGYQPYDSRIDGGELRYTGQAVFTPKAVGLIPVTNKIAFWNFKMRPIVNRAGRGSGGSGGGGGAGGAAVDPTSNKVDKAVKKGLYQQEIEIDKRFMVAGEKIRLDLNYINRTDKVLDKGYLKINLPEGLELIPKKGQFVKDGNIYIDITNLKPNELKSVSVNLSTDNVKATTDYRFESVLLDKNYNIISGLSHVMLRVYYIKDEKIFDGYMVGMPDGNFHPDWHITRAEVATVLVRHTPNRRKAAVDDYSDVNKGDWYYDTVSEALEYGYFDGYDDGTFKPNKKMTRAEIAEAITRFFKIDIENEDSVMQKFTDVEGNKYERQISLVARNSLMVGYPDKTFRPDAYTRRVEAALLFDGVFNRYPTPNVETSFYDIPKDYWAYGHISSVFRGFKLVNENGKIKVLSREKINPHYIK